MTCVLYAAQNRLGLHQVTVVNVEVFAVIDEIARPVAIHPLTIGEVKPIALEEEM